MANNQHKAFYGEHLASVYDNSDPYGAQGRQPTNHSSPPPQHQPQYYAQPQSTPGQALPHSWHRPLTAPSPPAARRPSAFDERPVLHSSTSSTSSSHSHSQYAPYNSPPLRAPLPPPPPPGAGAPLLGQRTDSRPPAHDYFTGPPPAQQSAAYASNSQQYQGQYSQQYAYPSANGGGAPPAVQYLPPAAANNRDSLSDLIGTYGDTSPGSQQGSFYGASSSPPPQASTSAGGAGPAAYASYSQPAYPNPSAAYASAAPLYRSQSAAVPGAGARGPPFTHAAAGYVQPPPLPGAASYSGHPSTESYQPGSYPAPQPPQNGHDVYTSQPPPSRQQPSSPSAYRQSPQLGERQKRGDSLWGTAPPSDAFFVPDLDRKKSLVQQAVSEAAGGGWRSTLDSTIAEHGDPAPAPAPGARQPTILTTPPIGAGRPPQSQRTPSLSSQASTASYPSSSNSVFTSSSAAYASTSTTRVTNGGSVHRGGTLSPNTSLSANSILNRADSGSSFGGALSSTSDSFDGADYLNVALLSNIAVWLRDNVPKGTRTKGALEHPDCFTGEEVVSTILKRLPPTQERRYALAIARSLQQSLWFHDIDWVDSFKEASVYAFDVEDYIDETPTGVLTSLTPCLSPYCGKLTEEGYHSACYSYSCPNSSRNQLQRQASQLSTSSSSEPADQPDNWVTFVGKAVADATDKMEVKRQLNIFELIDGEEKYFNDLELVRKNFVEPLVAANPPIIAPERIGAFLKAILLNVDEIREHSRRLLDALKTRQAKNPVVSGVGDILLEAALEWGPAYYTYLTEYPMAHVLFAEEETSNPRFKEHVMDFSRSDPATRLGFKSFQSRPTFRVLRYILLLEDIFKHTENNDEDKRTAEQAISVIKLQSKEANLGVSVTESKVKCREYHRGLITKNGDPCTADFDLDLLSETRRHIISTKIVHKSSAAAAIDAWSEGFWILFDHYLVMSKMPRTESTTPKYIIPRRGTIPLELLQIKPSSFTDSPINRSNRFHIGTQRAVSDGQPGAYSGGGGQDSMLYPIHLTRIGRDEGTFTFWVESEALRKEWAKRMTEAVERHAEAQKATQVVALDVLSDQTFGGASTIGSLVPSAPPESQFGNPTCSAPLTTADGQTLVVAGCAQGLFIGFRGKPRTMRQVVHLAGITQCAILPEFGFILVVAQKVLIAYSLEALVPSGGRTDQASKTPQRLSGSKDVLFMRVGKVGDVDPRTLVIYVKKSGVKESVFKALEPVSTADRTRAAGRHGFLGIGANRNPEWFRTYKDFFLPSFVYSFRFLRSKLAIVCAKGVEIMNLESLRTMSVPDFSHQRDEFSQKLAKRCDDNRTLGMFRLQDNLFLLVYSGFAFHVDKHGEPLLRPVGVIEWESRPDQVAFQTPFIYAFSSKMIEIRNAFTGRLAQVITGRDITLTYDGDGIDSGVVDVRRGSMPREEDHLDRRLHVSMRVDSYHVLYEIRPLDGAAR